MAKSKWMQIVTISLLGIIIILMGQKAILAQSKYPTPQDKYVNDYANVLEPNVAKELRNRLQDLERERGIEGTILTINSIKNYDTGDKTLEGFATNLFNVWGIGNKERNDGFLILMTIDDRMVRIELGKGYGNEFNREAQRVINQEMIPAFRDKAYSQGIYAGTLSTIAAVAKTHEVASETTGQSSGTIWPIVWIVIGIVGLFGGVIGLMIYDSSRHLSVLRKSWWRRKYGSKKHRNSSIWASGGRRGGGGGSFGGGSSSGGGASGKW
jgi:uncharacterized protein